MRRPPGWRPPWPDASGSSRRWPRSRWRSRTSTCPNPRVAAPSSLAHLCSTDRRDRAAHSYGRSYRDVVRLLRGDLPHPPDLVAHPADEADVVALLDWCGSTGVAAIPFGGGSSVVGGVEADVGEAYPGVLSLDLTRLDRVRRDRPGQPCRPHPGRRPRSRPRVPAPPTRAHAAPLPPVVRVLDARGLARHPGGRPLRHRLHPHRRPVRVPPGRHPLGGSRVPAAPGVGGGPLPRPPLPRVGGRAGRDHRGVDATPGPTPLEDVRRGRVPRPPCGRGRRAGAGPVGAVPRELPAARRRRGDAVRHPVPRRRCAPRPRVRVGRPPGGQGDGPGARAVPRPPGDAARAGVVDRQRDTRDTGRRHHDRRRARRAGRRRRRVAQFVPAGALHP